MGTDRRRWSRRLGILTAGVVAVGLLGYLALIVVFRAVVDPASLADRAEPHISAALNRRVTIGSADLTIFPRPEVRLLRLRIDNLPDFEGMPLATVDELHLRPRLLPLLRRHVEIDRVQAVGPRVLLQVDDQGRTNFGDFVPASREDRGSPDTPFSLEIRGIELVGGRVGYRDAVSGRSLQADGLWLEGSVESDADGRLALDLESGVDSLRFAYPPAWRKGLRGLRIQAAIEAVAGQGMKWIEIASGTATINGLTVNVSGRADSLRSPQRLLDLAIRGEEVDLSQLISALPDSIREAVPVDVWGDLGIDLMVRGAFGPGEFPVVDGIVTVRRGGVRRGEDGPLLEALDADVRVSANRAELSGARGRLPGGEVSAVGALALDSTLAFNITIDGGADAGELAAAFGRADPDRPAASRGTVRWNITGRHPAGRRIGTGRRRDHRRKAGQAHRHSVGRGQARRHACALGWCNGGRGRGSAPDLRDGERRTGPPGRSVADAGDTGVCDRTEARSGRTPRPEPQRNRVRADRVGTPGRSTARGTPARGMGF